MLFTVINLFVTKVFNANVESQGAAYATGVMVLISSACIVTLISKWKAERARLLAEGPVGLFSPITIVFLYTTVAIIIERPGGIKIASCFITAIIVTSLISRTMRSTELRFSGFQFKDDQSRFLWDSMRFIEFPILVPHRPGRRCLEEKAASLREEHHLAPDIPLVFIEVQRGDVSEFLQTPVTGSDRSRRDVHAADHQQRLDPARDRGRRVGALEGRETAGDPLRLVRRNAARRQRLVRAVR